MPIKVIIKEELNTSILDKNFYLRLFENIQNLLK